MSDGPVDGAPDDPRAWIEDYLETEPEQLFRVGFVMARRVLNGDRQAAEDVVQEAFIRVLHAARRDPGARPVDPVAYFRVVVASAAKDHIKALHAAFRGGGARTLSLSHEDNLTIMSDAPEPDVRARETLLRERVLHAIASLKPDHRDLLLRAFDPVALDFGGATHVELAAALGTTPHTVKSRLFEARKKLAALLQDLQTGEEGVSA